MEIRTELVEEDEERGRELSYPVLRGGTGTALRRLVYRQIEDKTDCDCRQNSNTQQNHESVPLARSVHVGKRLTLARRRAGTEKSDTKVERARDKELDIP